MIAANSRARLLNKGSAPCSRCEVYSYIARSSNRAREFNRISDINIATRKEHGPCLTTEIGIDATFSDARARDYIRAMLTSLRVKRVSRNIYKLLRNIYKFSHTALSGPTSILARIRAVARAFDRAEKAVREIALLYVTSRTRRSRERCTSVARKN